ncbi:hypothetical protein C4552_03055 [Candidatus Parcubacteria bacterium]|nr:MAG: hypothetical protein C4552_03055 [Candidatus Parcubacteria bacterium]
MKLRDVTTLPRNIGRAALEFSVRPHAPLAVGQVITLPYEDDAELLPFGSRGEFFYVRPRFRAVYYGSGGGAAPFVAYIPRGFLRVFRQWGEQRFRALLAAVREPFVIRAAQERWGTQKTLVYGDVYAYPLPWLWDKFLELGWHELGTACNAGKDQIHRTLDDTRWMVVGCSARIKDADRKFITQGAGEFLVFSGSLRRAGITAEYLEGPHIIAVARIVFEPPIKYA